MAEFIDSISFEQYNRAPMAPCTEPGVSDFDDDPKTLIWCNIDGEMRLYSLDGGVVYYQTLTLSAKTAV